MVRYDTLLYILLVSESKKFVILSKRHKASHLLLTVIYPDDNHD